MGFPASGIRCRKGNSPRPFFLQNFQRCSLFSSSFPSPASQFFRAIVGGGRREWRTALVTKRVCQPPSQSAHNNPGFVFVAGLALFDASGSHIGPPAAGERWPCFSWRNRNLSERHTRKTLRNGIIFPSTAGPIVPSQVCCRGFLQPSSDENVGNTDVAGSA